MKDVCFSSLEQAASHYRGETNFCGVIAVCIATGCKFGKARAAMARLGRKTGRGSAITWINRAIKEIGGMTVQNRRDLTDAFRGTHLKKITERLPKRGIFLVYTSGHVSAVRDGVLQDWAAETGSRKRIQFIVEVLPAHN